MRIVIVTSRGWPARGGAESSIRAVSRKIVEQYRHECWVLSAYVVKKNGKDGPVRFTTYRDRDELRRLIESLQPDVMLTHNGAIVDAVKVAGAYNLPVAVYFQSHEYYLPSPAEIKRWRVSETRDYPTTQEARYVMREADVRVVNSYAVQQKFLRRYGGRFDVIYPEFEPGRFLLRGARREGRFITGICGFAYKGAHIFAELAKSFPDETFLLVGNRDHGLSNLFARQSNIKLMPYCTQQKQFLRLSKIVLVPSQLPEPFGRIAIEGMANGIPVLASLNGGLCEILGDSGSGIRHYRDPSAWRRRLAELLVRPDLMTHLARTGRERVAPFLDGNPTRQWERLLRQLAAAKRPDYPRSVRCVMFGGATDAKTAFARINRQWRQHLTSDRGYRVSSQPTPGEFHENVIDYVIHHDYASEFPQQALPQEGKAVAVRTWDFGRFPDRWVRKINEDYDQLWVHCSWIRRQAIQSGVSPARVRIVPPGIDPQVFKPSGRRHRLATRNSFKFLFVGSTVYRKGIDILLRAYESAFGPDDDVCLVIKDHDRDIFYQGITSQDEIRRREADAEHPEILYIDTHWSEVDLAALYRACDVAVFPYRAEGFAIPILEAMACGTPAIVPAFGACLDYCTTSTSFLVPARRINAPVSREFAVNTLGFRERVEEVDFCELSPDVLAEYLRDAYTTAESTLRRKQRAGVQRAHQRFRWEDSAKRLKRHLAALDAHAAPIRLRHRRAAQARQKRIFETAKELFLNPPQKR
jgi:glycosyltransferase involved in cell wall biosynthesis